MAKLKITLAKSTIGAIPKQRKTAVALGLTKTQKTVIQPDNEAIRGMIRSIAHLVKVNRRLRGGTLNEFNRFKTR